MNTGELEEGWRRSQQMMLDEDAIDEYAFVEANKVVSNVGDLNLDERGNKSCVVIWQAVHDIDTDKIN